MPPDSYMNQTLFTKTMKSICKWADKNKDNKLTYTEMSQARTRLSQMKYTPKQKEKQQQQLGFSYGDYGQRYGHYLSALQEAKTEIHTQREPQAPFSLRDVSPFSLSDIDIIAGFDGNGRNITKEDWSMYTAPPTQAWND